MPPPGAVCCSSSVQFKWATSFRVVCNAVVAQLGGGNFAKFFATSIHTLLPRPQNMRALFCSCGIFVAIFRSSPAHVRQQQRSLDDDRFGECQNRDFIIMAAMKRERDWFETKSVVRRPPLSLSRSLVKDPVCQPRLLLSLLQTEIP